MVLNGLPTVEPAPIKQSADLPLVSDDAALRLFVEEMIQDERLDIETFEKLLGEKAITVAAKEVKLKPA